MQCLKFCIFSSTNELNYVYYSLHFFSAWPRTISFVTKVVIEESLWVENPQIRNSLAKAILSLPCIYVHHESTDHQSGKNVTANSLIQFNHCSSCFPHRLNDRDATLAGMLVHEIPENVIVRILRVALPLLKSSFSRVGYNFLHIRCYCLKNFDLTTCLYFSSIQEKMELVNLIAVLSNHTFSSQVSTDLFVAYVTILPDCPLPVCKAIMKSFGKIIKEKEQSQSAMEGWSGKVLESWKSDWNEVIQMVFQIFQDAILKEENYSKRVEITVKILASLVDLIT